MNRSEADKRTMIMHAAFAALAAVFTLHVFGTIQSFEHAPGAIDLSFGFLLLFAFAVSRVVKYFGFPFLTGYLIAGILAGPYMWGIISASMLDKLRLIDDVALSIIAFAAGAELNISSLAARKKAIISHTFWITIMVYIVAFLFLYMIFPYVSGQGDRAENERIVFAMMLAIIAVARSPSSAIALISETGAKGPFTDTILAVTVISDILVIILFSVGLWAADFFSAGTPGTASAIFSLAGELFFSFAAGMVIGRGIAAYLSVAKRDIALVLLFTAFFVSRGAAGLNDFIEANLHVSLHLEPLLICICAGFMVRNRSGQGKVFAAYLDRISPPVYILFFALAGACLDLGTLAGIWPYALLFVLIRGGAFFSGGYLAGRLAGDPEVYNRNAWMAYITQAGVSIGLARIVSQRFPETGGLIYALALACIAINQLVGPVSFCMAVNNTGEAWNAGGKKGLLQATSRLEDQRRR